MFFNTNLLKKLILKEWFRAFFSSFWLLFLLITVANLISGLLRGNVSAQDVLMNHLLEIPGTMNKILPISCLVGSLFSVNKLKTRNELTAIFASGLSRKDFFIIIFQASLAVALFQFSMSGFVGPYVKKYRTSFINNPESKFRNLKSRGLRASTIGSGKLWYRSVYYFFSFASFDKNKNELFHVDLFFISKNNKLQRKVSAKSMIFIQKDQWKVSQGIEAKELSKKDFPVIKKLSNQIINIKETPEDFLQIEADITTLNIINLYKYISHLKTSGINVNEYLVLLYDKFSSSIVCVLFALLASIAIFNPSRRNSSFGKSIAFIFIFTLSYWLIYSYAIELGKNSKIPPLVSTLIVPFFFLSILCQQFISHRKLK